jgi:hypothetical protein
VDETTKAWEEQTRKLEQVEKRIDGINQKIIDQAQNLKDSLANIDRDTSRSREESIAKLLREQEDLNIKANKLGGGLSYQENNRLTEVNQELSAESAKNPGELERGRSIGQLNDLQLIDYKATLKKQDETDKSNAATEKLQAELTKEQANKIEIVKLEQDKKQAVIDALNERALKTAQTYQKIEQDTTAHIATQTTQFAQLSALIDNLLAKNAKLNSFSQGPNSAFPGLLKAPVVTVNVETMNANSPADVSAVGAALARQVQLAGKGAN